MESQYGTSAFLWDERMGTSVHVNPFSWKSYLPWAWVMPKKSQLTADKPIPTRNTCQFVISVCPGLSWYLARSHINTIRGCSPKRCRGKLQGLYTVFCHSIRGAIFVTRVRGCSDFCLAWKKNDTQHTTFYSRQRIIGTNEWKQQQKSCSRSAVLLIQSDSSDMRSYWRQLSSNPAAKFDE